MPWKLKKVLFDVNYTGRGLELGGRRAKEGSNILVLYPQTPGYSFKWCGASD